MSAGRSTGRSPRYAHVGVGLVVCVALVVADLLGDDSLVLIPLLVLAPLVASTRGTTRETLFVAAVAVAVAVPLGWADDIAGTRRHWVAIATVALGGLLAVWLAGARDRRDHQLAETVPVVRAADRLKAVLATGRMGEWSWDVATGRVSWDANVAALFGLDDGRFGGTYEEWIELVDPRDRPMVQAAVALGVVNHDPFRFDHRCTWPDGSVHWIEGIGDVVLDADSGEIVAAFGLAVDVDERHRQVEERTRLLEFERRQRRRIEYLASVNDVLVLSVDVDEIVRRVTASVIPDLAEWCSIVVSIDRPRHRPSIQIAHRDPDRVRWAEQVQRDFPYDPDARWGAARVIRSGRAEFLPSIDPRAYSVSGGEVLREAGLGSVITVPLVGTLGTLGAMQLIRRDDQPVFSTADLEFVDELAGRVGAALNTAALFDRQSRSRAALDALQQVSGRIAAVATTAEIIHVVLVYGARGIGADGGSLFLAAADGSLVIKETTGTDQTAALDAQSRIAHRALDARQLVVASFDESMTERVAVGVPMEILNRLIGSLAFTFEKHRDLTEEESAMLVTLGSRCAGALERASLYERERAIALTFQNRLLSTLPTTPDWIEAAACYVPASGLEIGGDWFQILDAGVGGIAAVVGDAVGHGLAAAAAMGQLRASIATAVANDPDPDRALAAVDLFANLGADTLGASVAYILLQPDGPALHASAGHLPVIWVPANGHAALLPGGRRPLLGFRAADDHRPSEEIQFCAGDLFIMFTDGLVERRREPIDDGLRRLVEAVESKRHLPPQEMCDALIAGLGAGHEREDDVALLILKNTSRRHPRS